MVDALGERMKTYENVSRFYLTRRTYTIIRIDGKAFHHYTKGLMRPFDNILIDDMNSTAMYLCKEVQGTKFGYVQSDEISILITDFDDINTDAWFGNNIQKMCSVSASLATVKFNELRPGKIALFDSRVFQLPTKTEVINYFIW
jgi:tRNA(His) guanylyltransferase